MMFTLILLFNFAVQPKNALRQMHVYWSRSSKISMALMCGEVPLKVLIISDLTNYFILSLINKHLIFNGLYNSRLRLIKLLQKFTEV